MLTRVVLLALLAEITCAFKGDPKSLRYYFTRKDYRSVLTKEQLVRLEKVQDAVRGKTDKDAEQAFANFFLTLPEETQDKARKVSAAFVQRLHAFYRKNRGKPVEVFLQKDEARPLPTEYCYKNYFTCWDTYWMQ